MRKVLPVLMVLSVAIIACEDKAPTGPSRVETLTAPANGAPVVTITAPLTGSFIEGTSLTFTAMAIDDTTENLTEEISWTSSLDPVGQVFGTGGTVARALPLGAHTITATVTDRSGVSGSASVAVTITRRGPPVVTITSVPGLTTGIGVSFQATAIDPEDGDISTDIVWESTLDGQLGTGALLVRAGGLSEGTHIVTATVTDSDGLTGSDAASVTVDPVAPTAPTPPPTEATYKFVVSENGLATSPEELTMVFSLTATGEPTTAASPVSPTYSVTGRWSAPNDDTGALTGTFRGLPSNGAFTGVLTRPAVSITSTPCVASASFIGATTPTISASRPDSIRLDRSSDSSVSGCDWPAGFDSFDGETE